jgi:uncharacterized membrane protein YvbJ
MVIFMAKKKDLEKKGMELPINIIIISAILLIIMVIMIFFFSDKFGQSSDQVDDALENTGDIDRDGVPDVIDPCAGENPPQDERADNDDCKAGWTKDYEP